MRPDPLECKELRSETLDWRGFSSENTLLTSFPLDFLFTLNSAKLDIFFMLNIYPIYLRIRKIQIFHSYSAIKGKPLITTHMSSQWYWYWFFFFTIVELKINVALIITAKEKNVVCQSIVKINPSEFTIFTFFLFLDPASIINCLLNTKPN